MQHWIGHLAVGAIALVLVPVAVAPAAANDVCASEPVSARGEPSRYAWLAKTKARANWRAKVRALPGYGDDYANWARAANADERCLTGPQGTLCIMTGTPCRKP